MNCLAALARTARRRARAAGAATATSVHPAKSRDGVGPNPIAAGGTAGGRRCGCRRIAILRGGCRGCRRRIAGRSCGGLPARRLRLAVISGDAIRVRTFAIGAAAERRVRTLARRGGGRCCGRRCRRTGGGRARIARCGRRRRAGARLFSGGGRRATRLGRRSRRCAALIRRERPRLGGFRPRITAATRTAGRVAGLGRRRGTRRSRGGRRGGFRRPAQPHDNPDNRAGHIAVTLFEPKNLGTAAARAKVAVLVADRLLFDHVAALVVDRVDVDANRDNARHRHWCDRILWNRLDGNGPLAAGVVVDRRLDPGQRGVIFVIVLIFIWRPQRSTDAENLAYVQVDRAVVVNVENAR
jgi:hypothetical protein